MLVALARSATSRWPTVRRMFWSRLYDVLVRRVPDADWTFMNYGFVDEGLNPETFELDEGNEANRYPIQLYEKLAREALWQGAKGLEIGCGRGGGVRYVMERHEPHSMIGLDLSGEQIAFCRGRHPVAGLSFLQGDAENLPFGPESFDVVINVESSHCYASMDRFVREVVRVLKPRGRFLWADLRFTSGVDAIREAFERSGLTCVLEEDITRQVVAALDATSEAKERLIRERIPFYAREAFTAFAGVRGAVTCENLRSGFSTYLCGVWEKPRGAR